ncbi:MAG: aconitate hydratase AcnA [Acidimicrobiia bacterium]|nr:aconitate hydratase AcnA [Acidimicrobiia bacterium]
MAGNSFGARSPLKVGGASYDIFRFDALSGLEVGRLPYSLKVLLENLLRQEDGVNVTAADVEALGGWDPAAEPDKEIAYTPARVLMQDFTGVPAVVDLAAMRDAMAALGGDPQRINPLVPVDLVIDHSIQVDHFAQANAFDLNATLEFERNRERYEFLRWGQKAFDSFRVVPPNTGICHQVNLEYLSQVVVARDGMAFPDTLVGTDSHTPMVNGLGVVGWGVGGIEAEAAMLGQAIPLLIPRVVGVKLVGEMPEGATATDLVLTITELLRRQGVVGKFVELYGPGVSAVPVENRATIGNMSPEYGSTITVSPIDARTLEYLRFTGRPDHQVALVEAYAKEQGLWFEPDHEPDFSEKVELDLASVVPSLAGPSRPQDRVPLDQAKSLTRVALQNLGVSLSGLDRADANSFPASDPPSAAADGGGSGQPDPTAGRPTDSGAPVPHDRVNVTLASGEHVTLDHAAVVIAAITSCTNTSNPSVMLAAGLLARNAVERGLARKPWVKTSLAPGSQVVMSYYERAGLTPFLEKLGFDLVGYGCTTCIGNSGPLPAEISAAVGEHDLAVAAVLSGNRNFEGRVNPDVRLNYLASPPLVVAYALAGSMDWDPYSEPIGEGTDGPVYLRDIWPTTADVAATVAEAVQSDQFRTTYGRVFEGDARWQAIAVGGGDRMTWDDSSTYVRQPPYFEGLTLEPSPVTDITGARALAVLGDSVTTDHISPAGNIAASSPAGGYLQAQGVAPADFNQYGARRGNHEVMIRGTFANIRIRNRMVPDVEGGVTRHLPNGEQLPIYDAAMRYKEDGVPLVVLAGKEYGSGSSRDWAAKGTALLGVQAVITQSFERIHRSNLIGMGVLPLQFSEGESTESLGLTGEEVFSVEGLAGAEPLPRSVTVRADDKTFTARVRIDTPTEATYFRNGGVLTYMLRQLNR